MTSLCIFCASSVGFDPVHLKTACDVGKTLAQQGITVVYGGGGVGLMGAVADGALSEGGRVIGVLPEPLFGKEVAHTGLTELRTVASMHERKTLMYDLSDGFIALPGGLGTLEEIFEVITWAQLGLHEKPCGFLNVEGYFDPLLAFLDRAVERGFLKEKYRKLALDAPTLTKLLKAFESFRAPRIEQWIEERET